MKNNDVLRRVRYALNLNDNKLVKIWSLGGKTVTREDIDLFMSKEEDENYQETTDETLNMFLDGLITFRRGDKNDA